MCGDVFNCGDGALAGRHRRRFSNMKRLLVVLIGVLAVAAMAVPAALADSPHYIKGPSVSISGNSLTVSFKAAGRDHRRLTPAAGLAPAPPSTLAHPMGKSHATPVPKGLRGRRQNFVTAREGSLRDPNAAVTLRASGHPSEERNMRRFKTFAMLLCATMGLASVAAAATIEGTSGDDTLVGTQGRDTIHAKAGADTVNALGRADTVYGGRGKDRVSGGSGGDTLYGNRSADRLIGGPGDDTLQGGRGNDVINASDGSGGDTVMCGDGSDTVNADEGDVTASDCENVIG